MNEFFRTFDEHPFHQYLGLKLVEAMPDFVRLRLEKTATTPAGYLRQCERRRAGDHD